MGVNGTWLPHLGAAALAAIAGAGLATSDAGQPAGAGQQIFQSHCAVCHGADGKGNGPAARGLDPQPADLTSHQTQRKSEAQIHAIVRNGISGTAMTAWKNVLSERQIAEVVGYIKALSPRAGVRQSKGACRSGSCAT